MLVPLSVFHQNPKTATHTFIVLAAEKHSVKEPINSRLIPTIRAIRGSISALGPTHTT